MPRIAAVPARRAGWFGRLVYWISAKRFGKVPASVGMLAHAPALLFGASMFELAAERWRAVQPRIRHLVELRVAILIGCPF